MSLVIPELHIDDILVILERRLNPNNINQRNPFIALCDYASQNNWCWKINCTTCGHTAFRVGFSMLAKGYHPDEESLWPSKSKDDQDMMKESKIFNDFGVRSSNTKSQIKLAEIVSNINLRDLISVTKDQDEWMAYLGLVLHHCPDHKASAILSESLIKQLIDNTENDSIKDYLMKKDSQTDFLNWKDLDYISKFKY